LNAQPRIAFMTDSYNEVNGVALTSQRFVEYARERGLPFLCVRAGDSTQAEAEDINGVCSLELERGRLSFFIDRRQRHDLALWRYKRVLASMFKSFKPDLVHITGPSDVGQLGAYAAHVLRIPLVASWHTDLHKFAAHRLGKLLSFAPRGPRDWMERMAERYCLDALVRFYKIPRCLLAPNEEIVKMLKIRTGKPVYLMRRGVDTNLFSPARRRRDDQEFVIGYVGRLTPEKNVRLLVEIERALIRAGRSGYRFLIVGDGYERQWLEKRMTRAQFTGMITGEDLATAYANMDVFAFPSRTDTFGNVVLEALASGVPAVVTSDGGPKYLVKAGVTGLVARDDTDFIDAVVSLIGGGDLHRAMREQARRHAWANCWDNVFDAVYRVYNECLAQTSVTQLARAYAG
jgi:phosphatidylinositol alpha 1,6-mannosyltransferase